MKINLLNVILLLVIGSNFKELVLLVSMQYCLCWIILHKQIVFIFNALSWFLCFKETKVLTAPFCRNNSNQNFIF